MLRRKLAFADWLVRACATLWSNYWNLIVVPKRCDANRLHLRVGCSVHTESISSSYWNLSEVPNRCDASLSHLKIWFVRHWIGVFLLRWARQGKISLWLIQHFSRSTRRRRSLAVFDIFIVTMKYKEQWSWWEGKKRKHRSFFLFFVENYHKSGNMMDGWWIWQRCLKISAYQLPPFLFK